MARRFTELTGHGDRLKDVAHCMRRKPHPSAFTSIASGGFEDGHLTDGLGNTIDFKNTIIIMTSNIGARFLSKHTSLGFQAPNEAATEAKMEDAVMVEVKRLFNPEFINRLDEIIIFTSLTDDDLERIIELMIEQLNEYLVHKHLEVSLTEEAKRWILDKVCKDRNYGARPLRRAIQRYIEDPLSEALIQGNLSEISKVEVYRDGDELWYRSKDAEEVGVPLTI